MPKINSAFARNVMHAKTAGPWTTMLGDIDEMQFKDWVQANHIPWRDTEDADYDMRGYYKATNGLVPSGHYPDTYKTPYHETFSNESIYAKPTAPRWDKNRLIEQLTGVVLADEN